MRLRKGLILFALLFSYFLGFSHQLIPHCHHDEVRHAGLEHDHHHDEIHSHEHHIDHNDHQDHGFWDYILCQIIEVEHPSSGMDHWVYYPDKGVKPLEKLVQEELTFLHNSVLELQSSRLEKKFYFFPSTIPIPEAFPKPFFLKRGPPSIS